MSQAEKIEPLVELEMVNLILGGPASQVEILKSVNLNILKNKTVSVVGSSGSGKTSLLLLIAGLEKVTSGRISVNGQDLSALSEDALASFRRDNIGIVFQSFHLIPTMTALENVAIPLELGGNTNSFSTAELELSHVGLENRLAHYPSELSGGEQQRVAIARALAPKPKLILADEPTGNLDGETGSQIIDLLFSRTDECQSTLIFVTHDNGLAKQADRIIRLHDGKVETDSDSKQKYV